jgi:hypothetical protein
MRIRLSTAKARSPWHRERLRHVDAEGFTEADLESLPAMTKDDLMAKFDAGAGGRRAARHALPGSSAPGSSRYVGSSRVSHVTDCTRSRRSSRSDNPT